MASLRRSIVASIVFTLFGGPGILLIVLPWMITRFHVASETSTTPFAIGWMLIAAGLFPLLESIVRFVVVGRGALVPTLPTEHLVVSGLYRYVRNPMYVGVILAPAGEVLLFASQSLAIELAAVVLGFHLFVSLYEEPKLIRTFGNDYRGCQRYVRRWIPRLTPWKP